MIAILKSTHFVAFHNARFTGSHTTFSHRRKFNLKSPVPECARPDGSSVYTEEQATRGLLR